MGLTRIVFVWLPQGLSRAMSSATTVALSLHLYSLTGSAQVLASMLAIATLASVWASPFVGGIADHLPKRLVLLTGHGLLAGLVGVFACALAGGGALMWLLYAAILVSGALDAVVTITQQAAIRDVTSDAHLVRANAFVTFLQSAPLIIGPAVGAALYSALSMTVVLALDAGSFLLAGLGALALPHAPANPRATSWVRLPFAGARDGFATLCSDRDMRRAQLWYSLANIGNGLASGILAAWILQHATNPEAALGAFGTAGALGMVACALLMSLATLPGRRAHWVIAGLAAATLLGRAPLLGVTGIVAIVLVGAARSFFLELSGAPLLAIWQQATPRTSQGRIFGARRLLAQGPYPLAVWLGGFLSNHLAPLDASDSPVLVPVADPLGRLILASVVIELLAAVGLWRSRSLPALESRSV